MYFCQENRLKIKEETPGVLMSEMLQVLGEKWKKLPNEEKQPYVEKFKQDKARYYQEKATLHNKNYEKENTEE